MLADNTPMTSVAGLRRVLMNGSLEFPPFPAERYRRDVHTATYKCRAKLNNGYAVLSKNIHIHAVLNVPWEVHVPDEYVMAGNAAVLRCLVSAHCVDRIATTDWFTEDDISVFHYLGPKYQRLDDGSLYISAVSSEDRYNAFRCRVRDRITGNMHFSQYFGRIIVTEPKGEVRPRLVLEPHSRRVQVGQDVRLPCAGHAWPVPSYRWFREHHDQLIPIKKSPIRDRSVLLGGGLLGINDVHREDAGRFVCYLNNSAGEEALHFTLIITEPISVRIKPEVTRTKVNSNITFDCKVTGHPIEIVYWLHNGKVVKPNERVRISEDGFRIYIKNSQKNDEGVYQCFASNMRDQAYGIAEYTIEQSDGRLRAVGNRSRRTPYARSAHNYDAADWNFTGTRESKPELVYWFSEQTLQPGPSVSLKCVAMGHPPPQFSWTLDGFPIPTNSRFVVGQHVTLQDDVVSHLNISRVTEQDGGEYACVASNTAGKASHAARVNVYGLPFIREMPKVTAVAGSDLIIKCPVAGYPIESITWERGKRNAY
ncbi:unnamed protein product [Parnassius mnemosyne]|uniref:Hemolin n=1 Tax=Parnassius mnemosyne TaxID=213953 RepID=A0AAV1KND2_9NEOP